MTVNKYLRGELLGKGGFAQCYKVTEIDTGKVYAAKIIDKKSILRDKDRARLSSEIKI